MSGLDLYLSQSVFLTMLAVSAAAGVGLGLVYDILMLARLLLWVPLPVRSIPEEVCDETATENCSEFSRSESGEERVIEREERPPLSPGFWGDLLFSLILALTLVLLTYYTNDGVLRAPIAVGVAVGFGVWHVTLGLMLRQGFVPLSRFLRRLVRRLLSLLLRPLGWLMKPLLRLAKWVWRGTAGKFMTVFQKKRAEKQLKRLIQTGSQNEENLVEPPPQNTA